MYVQQRSAANGRNYLHRMYTPQSRAGPVNCMSSHHRVMLLWTVERMSACPCRATAYKHTAAFAGGTVSTTTACPSMLHLEQLMPLNTVITTIRRIAHDTRRWGSVQGGELADLWLDACDCIDVARTDLASSLLIVLWPPFDVSFQIPFLRVSFPVKRGALFMKKALKNHRAARAFQEENTVIF